MRKFTNLLSILLISVWIGSIAIFSIQNIQLVSLQFLAWQSLQLPIGVLLAFCLVFGLIFSALLPLFWTGVKR